MVTLLDRFTDRTRNLFASLKSDSFVDGAMAAAALVALADGDASLEEGAEVSRLMSVLTALQARNPQEGLDRYLSFVSDIRSAPNGVQAARDVVVQAAARDPEAAALILVICQAISEADGRVIESEVKEIQAISRLIDMDQKTALQRVVVS